MRGQKSVWQGLIAPSDPPKLPNHEKIVPMRLALLSDIHGNLPAFEAALAHAIQQGYDQMVILGDVVVVRPTLLIAGIWPSRWMFLSCAVTTGAMWPITGPIKPHLFGSWPSLLPCSGQRGSSLRPSPRRWTSYPYYCG
jgi:hypothetical protein